MGYQRQPKSSLGTRLACRPPIDGATFFKLLLTVKFLCNLFKMRSKPGPLIGLAGHVGNARGPAMRFNQQRNALIGSCHHNYV